MPTFLILQSPNKGNIGTTTEREEGFYKPTFYQISEQELAEFTAMSQHAKNAFIAEKLEAQMGTSDQVKKKIAPIVEVATKQIEKESVDYSIEENSNIAESATPVLIDREEQYSRLLELNTEIENEVDEIVENTKNIDSVIEKPKAKGRPKKVN